MLLKSLECKAKRNKFSKFNKVNEVSFDNISSRDQKTHLFYPFCCHQGKTQYKDLVVEESTKIVHSVLVIPINIYRYTKLSWDKFL